MCLNSPSCVKRFFEEVIKQGVDYRDASESDVEIAMTRLNRWNESTDGESVYDLKRELQTTMQNSFGVFRDGPNMREALKGLVRPLGALSGPLERYKALRTFIRPLKPL